MQTSYQNSVNYVAAFGSAMLTRAWTDESRNYRYGFNGMERDDEVKGSGNSYDFGARIYDSRLGRWLAVDPLYKLYFGNTTYSFALNNPMFFTDKDGKAIYDKYGKKVKITYDTQTGAITKIKTKDDKLKTLILHTHSFSSQGKTAVEKMNSSKVRYDIIVMDESAVMKGKNGYGKVFALNRTVKTRVAIFIFEFNKENTDVNEENEDMLVINNKKTPAHFLDLAEDKLKDLPKETQEEINSDIVNKRAVDNEDYTKGAYDNLSPEEKQHLSQADSESRTNKESRGAYSLIYEYNNSLGRQEFDDPNSEEAVTKGEEKAMRAVSEAQKERTENK